MFSLRGVDPSANDRMGYRLAWRGCDDGVRGVDPQADHRVGYILVCRGCDDSVRV